MKRITSKKKIEAARQFANLDFRIIQNSNLGRSEAHRRSDQALLNFLKLIGESEIAEQFERTQAYYNTFWYGDE